MAEKCLVKAAVSTVPSSSILPAVGHHTLKSHDSKTANFDATSTLPLLAKATLATDATQICTRAATGCTANECETNEEDDEKDDDDRPTTSSVKKVEIFLETPVPDDNNELIIVAAPTTTITLDTVIGDIQTVAESTVVISSQPLLAAATTTALTSTTDEGDEDVAPVTATTKPKRLSDEFFSADDGDYDNDADEFAYNMKNLNKFLPADYDEDVRMVPNPFPSVSPCVVVAPTKPDVLTLCGSQMLPTSFDEDEDSNLLIESSSFIEDELSSSSNMLDLNNEHDESSPHSSTSPIIIGLQDDDDAGINHSTDQELINHNDMMYFGANAESMDAIERNDLEHEHKLTGGFMMRCKARTTPTTVPASTNTIVSATCTSDSTKNRLNQGLVFSSIDVERNDQHTTKALSLLTSSENRQKHSTTPTSSRTKASRFGGAGSGGNVNTSVKINLSESLGKATAEDEDGDINEPTQRLRRLSSTIASSSSSSSPLSSAITCAANSGIAKVLDAVAIRNRLLKSLPQFDAFYNGNSNDSSSSDKSFRTSNYSNASNSKLCDHQEELSSSSIASPAPAFEKILCDFSDAQPNGEAGLAIASTSKTSAAHSSGIISKRIKSTSSGSTASVIRTPSNCKYSNHHCSANKKSMSRQVRCDHRVHNEEEDDDDDDEDDDEDNNAADLNALIKQENLLVEDEEVVVPVEAIKNSEEDQPTSSSSLQLPLPLEQQRISLPQAEQSAASNSRSLDVDLNFEQSQALMALENDHDYEDDTWADCEEITDNEEVCTCRDYSDEEWMSDDDELLPSREVDLSCYAQLTEENILANRAKTARNNRKRRMTETKVQVAEGSEGSVASPSCISGCDTTPGKRKRLLLDEVLSPKLLSSAPSTPTTISVCPVTSPSSATSTSFSLVLSEKRTPRSVIPTRDNPPPELGDWLLQFQLWTHAERLLAVDQLIEHCEPTQVRHMMKVIEPQFQRDFISLLPKELALQVLSYLEPQYLLRAAQTCRTWR